MSDNIDEKEILELCKNLKSYRKAVGWSQEQFADKVGITRQTIASIESGKKLPSKTITLAILHILSVAIIPTVFATFGNKTLKKTIKDISSSFMK